MFLIDTNIWLRIEEVDSELSRVCRQALDKLTEQGESLAVCAQVIIEFCVVMSRPVDANGFGASFPRMETAVKSMLDVCFVLPEPPNAAERWIALAKKYSPSGKRCHDLRLVAVAEANGIDTILTLNKADFKGISEIKTRSPNEV